MTRKLDRNGRAHRKRFATPERLYRFSGSQLAEW